EPAHALPAVRDVLFHDHLGQVRPRRALDADRHRVAGVHRAALVRQDFLRLALVVGARVLAMHTRARCALRAQVTARPAYPPHSRGTLLTRRLVVPGRLEQPRRLALHDYFLRRYAAIPRSLYLMFLREMRTMNGKSAVRFSWSGLRPNRFAASATSSSRSCSCDAVVSLTRA